MFSSKLIVFCLLALSVSCKTATEGLSEYYNSKDVQFLSDLIAINNLSTQPLELGT